MFTVRQTIFCLEIHLSVVCQWSWVLFRCHFIWSKCISKCIPVKLPWIFPGAPLKINGAPGNIRSNLTGMKCTQWTKQATGLDAWASRVKCPARFVSHLHEICIYIYMSCLWPLFLLLFVHYCKVMVCVVYWVGKWQSRGSTGMFGNLMVIYHIMLQFIQNHSRFAMLMIWK